VVTVSTGAYLVQPYPLWCAEVSPGGSISASLVVGWHVPLENDAGPDCVMVPVLARQSENGAVFAISEADIKNSGADMDDAKLVFGSSRDEVRRIAQAVAAG
jgi:hypothetical protein